MAKEGFDLNSFLKTLEDEPVEKTAEEVPEEEVPEEEVPAEEKEKVAQIMEEGQIMARAFHEELEKLAVGDGPMTPNPASVKEPNEVSHLSQGDIKLDQIAKVEGLLNQIQGAVRSGGGDLTYNFMAGPPQPAGTVEESVLPYDVASAQKTQAAAVNMNKAAADQIIDNLYKKVFGE
jgi:hypothetical protein